jgi:hypothetical protein
MSDVIERNMLGTKTVEPKHRIPPPPAIRPAFAPCNLHATLLLQRDLVTDVSPPLPWPMLAIFLGEGSSGRMR